MYIFLYTYGVLWQWYWEDCSCFLHSRIVFQKAADLHSTESSFFTPILKIKMYPLPQIFREDSFWSFILLFAGGGNREQKPFQIPLKH